AAQAGTGTTSRGSAGTIYLKDNAQANGNLIIDNGNLASSVDTRLKTGLTVFRRLTLRNSGRLAPMSSDITSFTVEPPVSLTSTSVLSLGTSVTMSVSNAVGFDFDVQSGSTLTLSAGAILNADRLRINAASLNTSIDLSFANGADLELSSSGV